MCLVAIVLVLFAGTKIDSLKFLNQNEFRLYIMWGNLLIKWGSGVRLAQVWGQDMSFGGTCCPLSPVATRARVAVGRKPVK